MTTANDVLLRAVFSQVDIKIDFDRLTDDIGAPSKGAAVKRWSRFLAKLNAGSSTASAAKPSGIKKKSTKTAVSKARGKKALKTVTEGDGEDGDTDEEPATTNVKKKTVKRKAGSTSRAKAKTKAAKREETGDDDGEVGQDEKLLLRHSVKTEAVVDTGDAHETGYETPCVGRDGQYDEGAESRN